MLPAGCVCCSKSTMVLLTLRDAVTGRNRNNIRRCRWLTTKLSSTAIHPRMMTICDISLQCNSQSIHGTMPSTVLSATIPRNKPRLPYNRGHSIQPRNNIEMMKRGGISRQPGGKLLIKRIGRCFFKLSLHYQPLFLNASLWPKGALVKAY